MDERALLRVRWRSGVGALTVAASDAPGGPAVAL
ncbi:MAG: hypothetical protein JWM10_2684, partial [Myxococcaceae bacterium]|nr:hypothetical protein [Myxococcaceae bacterium]